MNTQQRYEDLDRRMSQEKGKCSDLQFLEMHLEKMKLLREIENGHQSAQ